MFSSKFTRSYNQDNQIFLLRCNLHTIKVTLLKYTVHTVLQPVEGKPHSQKDRQDEKAEDFLPDEGKR